MIRKWPWYKRDNLLRCVHVSKNVIFPQLRVGGFLTLQSCIIFRYMHTSSWIIPHTIHWTLFIIYLFSMIYHHVSSFIVNVSISRIKPHVAYHLQYPRPQVEKALSYKVTAVTKGAQGPIISHRSGQTPPPPPHHGPSLSTSTVSSSRPAVGSWRTRADKPRRARVQQPCTPRWRVVGRTAPDVTSPHTHRGHRLQVLLGTLNRMGSPPLQWVRPRARVRVCVRVHASCQTCLKTSY